MENHVYCNFLGTNIKGEVLYIVFLLFDVTYVAHFPQVQEQNDNNKIIIVYHTGHSKSDCTSQDQMILLARLCERTLKSFFMISLHLTFSNSHDYNSVNITAKGHYTKVQEIVFFNNQNRS